MTVVCCAVLVLLYLHDTLTWMILYQMLGIQLICAVDIDTICWDGCRSP